MSQRGGDNDAGDLQLEAELAALVREREEIIAGSAIDASPELLRFKEALRRKLKAAADQREYQRANLRLQFDFEKQQAMDEYHFEKEKLREQIISAHAERRKRLESVKSSGGTTNRVSCLCPALFLLGLVYVFPMSLTLLFLLHLALVSCETGKAFSGTSHKSK